MHTIGQMDDLLGEINARVERGERTFVTTLTEDGRRLDRLLQRKWGQVKYMHSDIKTLGGRVSVIYVWVSLMSWSESAFFGRGLTYRK